MALHFSSLLTPTNIRDIAEKYGYSKPEYVEKFIMDFEMQYQILQKLPCTTRGGMCMPFYTEDHSANRLSIDIDLLTSETVENVSSAMNKINFEVDEIEIELIDPKGEKYPIPNLRSYRVYYDSFLGKRDWIKVDYFCEINLPISTKDISKNYTLFALKIDYDIQILSRGSLIGDKLSTLSLGTIGLPERKFAEIPKQIFDIGSQLRVATKQDVLEVFETFEQFTKFKISVFQHTPPFTIEDVVENIEKSLMRFFEHDNTAIILSHDEENRFSNFLGTYMGRPHQYKKTKHLGNILLILFLIKTIKNVSYYSKIDKEAAATKFVQVINQLNKFQTMYSEEIREQIRKLLSSPLPSQLSSIQRILRGQPIEYVFLLREIYR